MGFVKVTDGKTGEVKYDSRIDDFPRLSDIRAYHAWLVKMRAKFRLGEATHAKLGEIMDEAAFRSIEEQWHEKMAQMGWVDREKGLSQRGIDDESVALGLENTWKREGAD
jgi:hypothetical protein